MWFRSLFASLGSVGRRGVRGQPPLFRPAVEPLGERCLPAAGLSAALPVAPAMILAAGSGQSEGHAFHLSGAGTFTPVSATDVTFTASGTATALGHWTNSGELHFDGSHGTGVAVFKAASGDVLVARIDGTIDFATGAATGTFTFVRRAELSDGTVVRSTGSFAHVSGSAQLSASGFPAFTFTLNGEIATSAAHHKAGPGHGGVLPHMFW